jgi:hypothetical protein
VLRFPVCFQAYSKLHRSGSARLYDFLKIAIRLFAGISNVCAGSML